VDRLFLLYKTTTQSDESCVHGAERVVGNMEEWEKERQKIVLVFVRVAATGSCFALEHKSFVSINNTK
jgi:hypothetical protein